MATWNIQNFFKYLDDENKPPVTKVETLPKTTPQATNYARPSIESTKQQSTPVFNAKNPITTNDIGTGISNLQNSFVNFTSGQNIKNAPADLASIQSEIEQKQSAGAPITYEDSKRLLEAERNTKIGNFGNTLSDIVMAVNPLETIPSVIDFATRTQANLANQRAQQQTQNNIANITSLQDAQNIVRQGANQSTTGMLWSDAQNWSTEANPTLTAMQQASAEAQNRLVNSTQNPLGQLAIEAGISGADLLARSALTGGSGAAFLGLTGVDSGVNYANSALNEGYSIDEATARGLAGGALTAGIESVAGIGGKAVGNFLKGTVGKTISSALPKSVTDYISNFAASKAGQVITNGLAEGSEEVAEYYSQALLDKIILDKDTPTDVREALNNFAVGALVGGGFGAVNSLNTPTQKTETAPAQSADITAQINNITKAFEQGTLTQEQAVLLANEYIQDLPENTKQALITNSPQAQDVRAAVAQINTATQTAQQAAITNINNEIQAINNIVKNTNVDVKFAPLADNINGMFLDGKVIINENNQNPLNTFAHELTHSIEKTGEYAEFSSLVKNYMGESFNAKLSEISAGYASQGVNLKPVEVEQEVVANFVENSGMFNDQNFINRIATEKPSIAQRVYNWINDAIKRFTGNAEVQFLTQAKRMYEQALKSARMSNNISNNKQFSLDTDSNGKELSQAQQEFFKDSKVRDAKGQLLEMYRGGNEKINVFDRAKSSYSNLYGRGFYFTNSIDQANVYGAAQPYYLNIKNPLSTSETTITKPQLKKFLKEVKANEDDYSFENYGYDATIEKVANDVYGKSDFEMLQDINTTAIGNLVEAVELFNNINKTRFDGFVLPTETVAFNSNQIKSTDNLNPTENPDIRFSLDIDKTKLNNLAKDTFGTTTNWQTTGYLTPSGDKLDFSGKRYGSDGRSRQEDHREIADVYYEFNEDVGGTDAMVDFMSKGNIRISPESGGINLSIKPTKIQERYLSDYISKNRGEILLDLDNTDGITLESVEYPRGTHANKIINDIKNYFDNGTVPYVSDVAKYRAQYSISYDGKKYSKYKAQEGKITDADVQQLADPYIEYRKTKKNRGRLSKEQWLNSFESIGKELANRGKSEADIEQAMYELWFKYHPNQKTSLNREGKGYVRFMMDEAFDAIERGANQVPEYSNVLPNDVSNDAELDIPFGLSYYNGEMVDFYGFMQNNPDMELSQAITEFNSLPYEAPVEPRAQKIDKVEDFKVPENTRKFAESAAKSTLESETKGTIREQIESGTFTYDIAPNVKAEQKATKYLSERGYSESLDRWKGVANSDRIPSKDDIVLGELLLQEAAANKDVDTAMQLVAELAAVGTQMGQSIQAMSMLNKLTPQGQLYYLNKSVDKLQKSLTNKQQQQIEIAINKDLAQELLDAKTPQEIETATSKIKQDLANQMPNTWMTKWDSWRYLAMLGNPKTHFRNLIGNAVFMPAIKAKNGIAQILEKTLPVEQRTKSVLKSKDLIDYATKDFETMKDVITGENRYSQTTEIQRMQRVFKNNFLEKARELNFKFLEAEDILFVKQHYTTSLAGFMQARGLNADTITPKQLLEAQNYAMTEAQKATYRDFSKAAQAINKFLNINKATKIIGGGILPFTKTPINITKRAVEYSPIGLINGTKKMVYDVKNGTATPAEAIDDLSKGIVGSGLTVLGMLLGNLGMVTGSGDDDDNINTLNDLQGEQNYSLKIGDTYFTIDWLAPLSMPFFVGVEISNALKNDGITLSRSIDALSKIFSPVVEMSMLQGIDSLLTSIKYGQEAITDAAIQAFTGYVTQGTPTLVGQVARTIDPVRRTTYTDKSENALPSILQKPLQATINKIPGLSTLGQPYIDQWGRQDVAENTGLNAFENFISPSYISQLDITDVDAEMERLYKATDETGVVPKYAPKYFTSGGETIHLSGKDYVTFATVDGQTAHETLNAIIELPQYKALDDATKVEVVKDVYTYAGWAGKNAIGDYPPTTKWIQTALEGNAVDTIMSRYTTMPLNYDNGELVISNTSNVIQEAVGLDTSTLRQSTIDKAAGYNITPQDWKYVSERIDAYDITEKPKVLQDFGFEGESYYGLMEEFVLSDTAQDKLTVASENGIEKSTYINGYAFGLETQGTKAERNAQIQEYVNKLDLTSGQKEMLYGFLEVSQGSGSSSGGSSSGSSSRSSGGSGGSSGGGSSSQVSLKEFFDFLAKAPEMESVSSLNYGQSIIPTRTSNQSSNTSASGQDNKALQMLIAAAKK